MILFLDTETTGLDSKVNGIISIAVILLTDAGQELHRQYFTMCTFNYTTKYSKKALVINHFTLEDIKGFTNSNIVKKDFINMLEKYSDGTKYIVNGYNIAFDIGFLSEWLGHKLYYEFMDYKGVCTFELVKLLDQLGLLPTISNHKLTTLCEVFNISLEAHNATSDIQATKELYDILTSDKYINYKGL